MKPPISVSSFIWLTFCFIAGCYPAHAIDQASLRVIAKSGADGIATIRPEVSINNRGTVAFRAITQDGHSTVFAVTPDGQVKNLLSRADLATGDYVQVNDNDDVAFRVGPLIGSSGGSFQDPLDPTKTIDASSSSVTHRLYSVNALSPESSKRTLVWSLLNDSFAGGTPVTKNGPFADLGPAFSLNGQGRVAFLTDISLISQITDYRLATSYESANWHLFPTDVPLEESASLLLADNGRIVLKASLDVGHPLSVLEAPQLTQMPLASTNSGFQWIGSHPGITHQGSRVAFVAGVTTHHPSLPPGDGLFLSAFTNGQWITRLVLGTNYAGTNLFSRFHSFYRTCVAELVTQTNSVKICFGAASPSGRVGLYSVIYDYVQSAVTSIETLLEAGRDIAGLGPPTSFELFDSVNGHGEIALWLQTPASYAVIRAGSQIDAIDPLLLVTAKGTITTDSALLAAATNTVQGLAADGVTRILIRVETPGDGDVTFRIRDDLGNTLGAGLLSAVGSTSEDSDVTTHTIHLPQPDGRFMAFAVLRSPRDFVNPFKDDETLTFRRLEMEADFAPQGHLPAPFARRQLRLHRPPVVLLHGIWSDSSTWKWPLLQDERFAVHPYNYSSSSSYGLENNVSHAKQAIDAELDIARKKYNMAAIQVDFVGHSMGGLLARYYVGSKDTVPPAGALAYYRADNYRNYSGLTGPMKGARP